LLIKKSSIDFHAAHIYTNRLTSSEMGLVVQVGQNTFGMNNVVGLVDLELSFLCLFEICIIFKLLG